jgi:hypothetical protein
MERWGVPESSPTPPRRPTPASQITGGYTSGAPVAGFGRAFESLVGRKLRELGPGWRGRSQRDRRAEAARRASNEMASRIERQTGRRPADSTIRRNARTNKMPRGVDAGLLARQASIDAAGGIRALAQLLGVSQYAVRRWRDEGRPLVPGGLDITADVDGVLVVNGEEYPRSLTVTVTVYPPAADDVRIAYAFNDMDTIAQIIGPEIAEQMDWAGEADRQYTVTEITDITLN